MHFAPGKSFQQGAMHTHDLVPFGNLTFDLSHNIDKLSFGHEYPGMANPLDRVAVPKYNTRNPQGVTGTYQYFLKVPSHIRPVCLILRSIMSACMPCSSMLKVVLPSARICVVTR